MYIGLTAAAVVLFGWLVVTLTSRPSTITVIGTGRLTVAPEQVSFIVSKVSTGPFAVAVITEGDNDIKTLMNLAQTTMNDPESQVSKAFYNVTQSVSNSYIVANAFSVKTKKVQNTEALIKTLFSNGATNVSNVSFTTLDPDKTEQEARINALKDAQMKAQNIVTSAGKRLGRLVSVQDDQAPPESSIQTGTNINIIKRVAVVYELW